MTRTPDHDDRHEIDHLAAAEKWLKIAEDQLAARIQRFSSAAPTEQAADTPDDDGQR